jgi:hypothetical protein
MDRKAIFAVGAVAILLLAVGGYFATTEKKAAPPTKRQAAPALPPGIDWNDIYDFGAQGYEPGLVVDSKGYMYYTAHKNLDDKTSWPYLASWFFYANPDGTGWKSPDQPPIRGQKWKTEEGDEGDIGVDANDRIYFVDTFLKTTGDNHIHVFDDPGVWQYSVRYQKTNGRDDRPWITAQGSGIVNYLGNNGVSVNGGREWVYRSTDGGRVSTLGTPVPGNGWGHIDAERKGTHVYIISESDTEVAADIRVYASSDSGATWHFDAPVVVAHRNGPGSMPGVADGFPIWVCAGPDGAVWCIWSDTEGTDTHNHVYVGWSFDYGVNWNTTEITPWNGYFLYPTLNVGEDGTVAVAFYGTESVPVTDQSEWFVYAAMIRPDSPFHPTNPAYEATVNATQKALLKEIAHSKDPANITNANSTLFFNFTKGEQGPCTTGTNLHDLHDFFEIAVGPDGYLNVAYQHYIGPANGHSELYFVRGTLPGGTDTNATRAG